MKSNEQLVTRSTQDPFYSANQGYYGGGYPGGSPYPGLGGSPFDNPNLPAVTPTQTTGTGGGLGLGNFNLNQIKGVIDKMGGIDGIVGTMTRVQKMVSSFQQMAPMIKLLMGTFGSSKAKAAGRDDDDDFGSYSSGRRKHRRRRKKRSIKKTYKGTGKVWSPKAKKRRR